MKELLKEPSFAKHENVSYSISASRQVYIYICTSAHSFTHNIRHIGEIAYTPRTGTDAHPTFVKCDTLGTY